LPATELMVAALPERQPLLDPILASNSLALLYGPRGLGKTFVALGIAWAAASGGSFLGWQASRPHKVLYIDGEMAAVDIRDRLRLLGSAPPTLDFLIADLGNQSLPDLGYYEGQGRLQRAWGSPELVVLDNLSSLAGFKSGDPDCWTELQRFLMLQRRKGRAVLVVHHANKQGKQRGTNRREDVLDLVMGSGAPPTGSRATARASRSTSTRRAVCRARRSSRSRRNCSSITSPSRAGRGGRCATVRSPAWSS
jgi:hypothetical protein